MGEPQLIEAMMDTVRAQTRLPELAFDPLLRFRDIPGYDSVITVQLVLGLERRFDLVLDEDEVETMHTLGDLLAVLRARVLADAR